MPVIELDGVARRYETGAGTVTALEEVDLTVEAGELVVVLGPSGSGKTTLLNIVGALDTATEGNVRVAGHDLATADRATLFRYRRVTVSFVFQSFNLFPALTALENVRFGADVARRPEAEQIARDTIADVGLAGREGHFPSELSGGEQQRVAIARALTFRPPFLLMDEPFGALDLITRDRMAEELLRIWANTTGTTVMFITHSIPEAVLLSDRVVVMSAHPGRVEQVVDIDLPRPRTEQIRESRAFFEYDTALRRMLIEAESGAVHGAGGG